MASSLGSTDEHFMLLVDKVRDYAIFMLDPGGRVATWNKGAQRIKGYSAEEIVGQHFSEFYRREDVARGVCEDELETALREGRCEDFGWRVRKDGSQFWAHVVITALRDASGKHIGFAKVTRDMTDRAYRTFIEATNAISWTTDADGRPNADSPTWRSLTGQTEAAWRDGGFDVVHGTCILVVDDNPDAVALLSQLLANVGARAETAASADEALDKVRRMRPDVIVSDIGMPNVDGYELMRRVRALPSAEGGRTPAIAVTAYARSDDAARAFAAGFQRHVPKPIDPTEMVFAVANLAGLPLDGR